MDTDIFRVIYKFGNIVALIPFTTNRMKPSRFLHNCHELIAFLIYTCVILLLMYYRVDNNIGYTIIQQTLSICADVVIYVDICVTVLSLNSKKSEWSKLVKNLRAIEVNKSVKADYWIFLTPQIIFIGNIVAILYACINYLGRDRLATNVCIFVQYYSQCFLITVLILILKMLLLRYRYYKRLFLVRDISIIKIIESTKLFKKHGHTIYKLRQTVDIVNSIFGWTILSNTVLFSLKNLIFLDAVIRDGGIFKAKADGEVAVLITGTQVVMLILLWVGFLSINFLCDAILDEYDEIFKIWNQLEINVGQVDSQEWYNFDKIMTHCCPRFSAARFFLVCRSTVFTVLGSITTFIIVIIQFKFN
ncbi:hypothetical protein Zmor_018238 [Zophobas morio]|uniref:Gustatory receptor n=1 Tax=Zophobas morio TaxID=2755281 RepID=A0AA38I6Q9_9CUCU|nr:hypothetical protein Zmor_018238 [Zophobas morio]